MRKQPIVIVLDSVLAVDLSDLHLNDKRDETLTDLQHFELSKGARHKTMSGASKHKAKGPKIKQVRFNDKVRLHFITFTHNERRIRFALGINTEHKPENEWYMQPAILNAFLKKHIARIREALDGYSDDANPGVVTYEPGAGEIAALEVAAAETKPDELVKTEELEFYNKHILQLAHSQQGVLAKLLAGLNAPHIEQYTAMTAGAPGGGKSLLAYLLLQAILGNEALSARRIYFTVESAYLRETMQEQVRDDRVAFNNYLRMLHAAGVIDEDTTIVDQNDTQAFFDTNKTRHAELAGVTSTQFMQECMVMANCETLEAYQAIGLSQSLFHNDSRQLQLWELFQTYKEQLAAKNQFHIQLSRIDPSKSQLTPEDIIIVDESLDYTLTQMLNLVNLGARIVFFGDGNQNLLYTTNTSEAFRHALRNKPPESVDIIKMDQSHRFGGPVATMASNILAVKKTITPHGSDLVDTVITGDESRISDIHLCPINNDTKRLIAPAAEHITELLASYGSTTAIICRPESTDEIKTQLGHPQVFNALDAKGSSFKTIILWDMISEDFATQLVALVEGPKKSRDELTPEDMLFALELNAIFVAITRAEDQLILAQSNISKPVISKAIGMLLDHVEMSAKNILEAHTRPADTAHSWCERIQYYMRQQNLTALKTAHEIVEQQAKQYRIHQNSADHVDTCAQTYEAFEQLSLWLREIDSPQTLELAEMIEHHFGIRQTPVAAGAGDDDTDEEKTPEQLAVSAAMTAAAEALAPATAEAKADVSGDNVLSVKHRGEDRSFDLTKPLKLDDLKWIKALPKSKLKRIKLPLIQTMLCADYIELSDDLAEAFIEFLDKWKNLVFSHLEDRTATSTLLTTDNSLLRHLFENNSIREYLIDGAFELMTYLLSSDPDTCAIFCAKVRSDLATRIALVSTLNTRASSPNFALFCNAARSNPGLLDVLLRLIRKHLLADTTKAGNLTTEQVGQLIATVRMLTTEQKTVFFNFLTLPRSASSAPTTLLSSRNNMLAQICHFYPEQVKPLLGLASEHIEHTSLMVQALGASPAPGYPNACGYYIADNPTGNHTNLNALMAFYRKHPAQVGEFIQQLHNSRHPSRATSTLRAIISDMSQRDAPAILEYIFENLLRLASDATPDQMTPLMDALITPSTDAADTIHPLYLMAGRMPLMAALFDYIDNKPEAIKLFVAGLAHSPTLPSGESSSTLRILLVKSPFPDRTIGTLTELATQHPDAAGMLADLLRSNGPTLLTIGVHDAFLKVTIFKLSVAADIETTAPSPAGPPA